MKVTNAENVLMLISLLKEYKIRKVIASPGTMNIHFVGSIQDDPYFEIYSAVDERSAAYMACGMSAESGEPVCLSCTGATASRNYLPGLTEAYYRKLPVIAITSTQPQRLIGHHVPQVIDRSVQPKDTVCYSAYVRTIRGRSDRWEDRIEINKALIRAMEEGGGPVHINLESPDDFVFEERPLPEVRRINYYTAARQADWPEIPARGRIGIFIGSHRVMSEELEKSITAFCGKYDSVVFCDRTSNYFGPYRILPGLVMKQEQYASKLLNLQLLIHIGDVAGGQYQFHPQQVWRVSEDGEIRDTFQKLDSVFRSAEADFFRFYGRDGVEGRDDYLREWKIEIGTMEYQLSDIPFSNLWLARQTLPRIPKGFKLYLGILNTLRSWDYFEAKEKIPGFANTGGFGIDGGISSLVGGALSDPKAIHLGIFGDLGFFYDMNVLGNRHFPGSIRIVLVNNGRGFEFRKYNHPAGKFGEKADRFMAAGGHFGNQSPDLIRHFAGDLGFDYIPCHSKEEYTRAMERLLDPNFGGKPLLLEVFTDFRQENEALSMVNNLRKDGRLKVLRRVKQLAGRGKLRKVREIIRR